MIPGRIVYSAVPDNKKGKAHLLGLALKIFETENIIGFPGANNTRETSCKNRGVMN
jgi:hypothetical protein